jgi:hypothetical protein
MNLDDFAQGSWLTCEQLEFAIDFANNEWIMRAVCPHGRTLQKARPLNAEHCLTFLYERILDLHKEKK